MNKLRLFQPEIPTFFYLLMPTLSRLFVSDQRAGNIIRHKFIRMWILFQLAWVAEEAGILADLRHTGWITRFWASLPQTRIQARVSFIPLFLPLFTVAIKSGWASHYCNQVYQERRYELNPVDLHPECTVKAPAMTSRNRNDRAWLTIGWVRMVWGLLTITFWLDCRRKDTRDHSSYAKELQEISFSPAEFPAWQKRADWWQWVG